MSDEVLQLAQHILQTKAADFDPAQFKDHYEEAVVELIRKKQENIPVKTEKEPLAAPNVIELRQAQDTPCGNAVTSFNSSAQPGKLPGR